MMRWDDFGHSLLFAALAAAALPVAVTLTAPVWGAPAAVRVYAIAAAVLYTSGLAAGRSARVGTVALAGSAGLLLALSTRELATAASGAAAIIACGRSILLGRARPLRTGALEAVLAAAGLAVAAFLARGNLLSLCLALWGYFLVQSSYFLIAAGGERAPIADPFERARSRLVRLLEDDPGPC